MLWTVKQSARFLSLDYTNVYYLITMGKIESVKIGRIWRLNPEEVKEYDKRFSERKTGELTGNFIYQGNGGFLFYTPDDCFPHDSQPATSSMERRRGKLVHCKKRSEKILLQKFKPISQLELFTA